MQIDAASPPVTAASSISGGAAPASNARMSFRELLQALNPLNHIPGVRDVYQRLAGSPLGAVARIVGGALMGGPIGAALAVVTTPFQDAASAAAATPDDNFSPHGGRPRVIQGITAQVPAAAEPRRGGWLIAAAYATRDLATPPLRIDQPSAPHTAESVRARPGGWLINSAYANFDNVDPPRGSRPRLDTAT